MFEGSMVLKGSKMRGILRYNIENCVHSMPEVAAPEPAADVGKTSSLLEINIVEQIEVGRIHVAHFRAIHCVD